MLADPTGARVLTMRIGCEFARRVARRVEVGRLVAIESRPDRWELYRVTDGLEEFARYATPDEAAELARLAP